MLNFPIMTPAAAWIIRYGLSTLALVFALAIPAVVMFWQAVDGGRVDSEGVPRPAVMVKTGLRRVWLLAVVAMTMLAGLSMLLWGLARMAA